MLQLHNALVVNERLLAIWFRRLVFYVEDICVADQSAISYRILLVCLFLLPRILYISSLNCYTWKYFYTMELE